MSGRVVQWAWDMPGLSCIERCTLMALGDASEEWENEVSVSISMKDLAKRLEVVRPTIVRSLHELEERGLISRIRRWDQKAATCNKYVINIA
jgi:DNA-binding Lrp family transcriptional regulator